MSEKVFTIERQGAVLVVSVQGDGTGFRHADIQVESNGVRRSLAESNMEAVVIDLGALEYFGSELIGVVVAMAREAAHGGARVALCRCSPKMQQVMSNMRLFHLWPHFESRSEAVTSLTSPEG